MDLIGFFSFQDLLSQATALKNEGNDLYLKEENDSACQKYSQALDTCPLEFKEERAVFLSNRAAAKKAMVRIERALMMTLV